MGWCAGIPRQSSQTLDHTRQRRLVTLDSAIPGTLLSGSVDLIRQSGSTHYGRFSASIQGESYLAQGEGVRFAALAQREGVSRSYFTRLVRLSYLAPDITQAILDGRQPRDLTPVKLLAHSRLPLAWHDQRAALGFA